MTFSKPVRTDFSVDAFLSVSRQIRDKFALNDKDLRLFGSWLRNYSGMAEFDDSCRDISLSAKLDVSHLMNSSNNDSLYENSMRKAFRACDYALQEIENFNIQNVQELIDLITNFCDA